MKYFTSSLIALAFAATAVQAQDAAQAPQDPNAGAPEQTDTAAPSATPAPDETSASAAQAATPDTAAAPGAGATAQTAVSDTEVDQFAKATLEVQKIDKDAKLDENAKQTKMADAVKASGLEPARYNEIGKAIATDTALREKVQMAMAKYAGPSQG